MGSGVGAAVARGRAGQARHFRPARLDHLDGTRMGGAGAPIPLRCPLSSCGYLQTEAQQASRRRREGIMADISLEAVTGKLNRIGYDAFIKALRHAKSTGNRNVELAHWLFHILQEERTDIGLSPDHFGS